MKNFKHLIGLVALVQIVSGAAFAGDADWRNIRLRSLEAIEIDIDYPTHQRCFTGVSREGRSDWQVMVVEPVWFNILGTGPASHVQVQVEFYEQDMIRHGSTPNPLRRSYRHYDRTIDLNDVGHGRFSGNAGAIATKSASGSAYVEYRVVQKVRVFVDGRALTDPISRTDQFEFSMYDQKGCVQ
ncbi:MAG: hypothetical protein A2X94_11650 [Bdellovibrionales bacterium GWB1_55_8]|nr:MAG: hypothetical protein A2X94_11650 [Bdellovibrionales bacterium GWB1_55_8]